MHGGFDVFTIQFPALGILSTFRRANDDTHAFAVMSYSYYLAWYVATSFQPSAVLPDQRVSKTTHLSAQRTR